MITCLPRMTTCLHPHSGLLWTHSAHYSRADLRLAKKMAFYSAHMDGSIFNVPLNYSSYIIFLTALKSLPPTLMRDWPREKEVRTRKVNWDTHNIARQLNRQSYACVDSVTQQFASTTLDTFRFLAQNVHTSVSLAPATKCRIEPKRRSNLANLQRTRR